MVFFVTASGLQPVRSHMWPFFNKLAIRNVYE